MVFLGNKMNESDIEYNVDSKMGLEVVREFDVPIESSKLKFRGMRGSLI